MTEDFDDKEEKIARGLDPSKEAEDIIKEMVDDLLKELGILKNN